MFFRSGAEFTMMGSITEKRVILSLRDSAEKLVAVIEKNKLQNSYGKQVTLLAVVDSILPNLDLEKVATLLKGKADNFHAIDLWINAGDDEYVMANVHPSCTTQTFKPKRDLDPLMY
jgi:hypothetical protein